MIDLMISWPLKISLIVLLIAAGMIGLVLMVGRINLTMPFKKRNMALQIHGLPGNEPNYCTYYWVK